MAWSTRQLAELAGTTVKAVRHYHDIGLLDLPDRASNGYKQYGIAHLVRLLQIRRLSDLGVPLSSIASLGAEELDAEEAVRALDAELESTIERLQQTRAELAVILQNGVRTDVPAEFASVAEEMSEADRALILVSSRVYSAEAMKDIRGLLDTRDPIDDEFDSLPADADQETIESLAVRFAPVILRHQAEIPWLEGPASGELLGAEAVRTTMAEAVLHLYNPAQLEVMRAAYRIAHPEA